VRKRLARPWVVGVSLVLALATVGWFSMVWASGATSAGHVGPVPPPGSGRGVLPKAAAPCLGTTGNTITHVIVLFEENSSEPIVKNASMPFLRSVTKQCGLATNAHNLTHPSTGNYIGLTSGQVQGNAWSKDGGPGNYPQTQDNIFYQLDQAKRSWGVYAQSMPSNCYQSNAGAYYVRHTAAPYFDDINGRSGSADNSCATNDRPLGNPQTGTGNNFYSALYDNGGTGLPAFSLVAPDVCHDLHGQSGTCKGSVLYTNADQFLQTWVGLIVNSPQYVAGHVALVITWDEGSGPDETSPEACWAETIPGKRAGGKPSCWIADIVVSPGTAKGARSATAYNHYDVLAAIETILGLPGLAANPAVSGSPDGSGAQFISAFGL